jgi:arginase family enzyme
VGTPAPGGLAAEPLIAALRRHAEDPRLLALEVVEYNPHRDPAGRTAAIVEEVLAAVMGGR